MRTCRKCREKLPLAAFSLDDSGRVRARCDECRTAYCMDCGARFVPLSGKHWRCADCGPKAKEAWRREWFRTYRKERNAYFLDDARRRRREGGAQPFELKERANRQTRRDAILDRFDRRCAVCGYDRCARSLHVHHRDPARKQCDKDYMKKSFTDFDNLIVLCSNCHFEVHDGLLQL